MKTERARLRRELREKRRAIPAPQRIAAAQSLAQRLLSLPSAPHAGHVAGYWAMDGEIALHAWQLHLPPSLTYCLPVLVDGGMLSFAAWRPGEPLTANRFGIPEPEVAPEFLLSPGAMAMVVVPLVGFDARCQRLGMGGGWYDRSFAFRRTQPAPPWLVGAAFAVQQVESVMPEDWDMPLDALCSETDAHLFDATPAD